MSATKHPGQEKLERWQAWQLAGGWRGSSALYVERVDCVLLGDGFQAADAEAIVTDRFVTRLPDAVRRTVKAYYLDRVGNSRDGHAQRLGIAVSTFDKHLATAYALIDGMWADHVAQLKARRAA